VPERPPCCELELLLLLPELLLGFELDDETLDDEEFFSSLLLELLPPWGLELLLRSKLELLTFATDELELLNPRLDDEYSSSSLELLPYSHSSNSSQLCSPQEMVNMDASARAAVSVSFESVSIAVPPICPVCSGR